MSPRMAKDNACREGLQQDAIISILNLTRSCATNHQHFPTLHTSSSMSSMQSVSRISSHILEWDWINQYRLDRNHHADVTILTSSASSLSSSAGVYMA